MPFGTSAGRLSSPMGMMNAQESVQSLLSRGGAESPSSLYSCTPMLGSNDQAQRTPNHASRGFGLRADVNHPDLPANRMPVAANLSPTVQWGREPEPAVLPDRHPSDPTPEVDAQQDNNRDVERGRESSNGSSHTSRHKKRHRYHYCRRRHRHHQLVWVRKRGRRGSSRTCSSLLHGHTRIKCISTIISGIFLAIILTIYLSLALTIHDLGQEVHILFILVVLGSLVFFVHSLIRLCVLAVRGPERSRRRHNAIPSVAGPGGFAPDVPIRVHLASDEEIAAQDEDGAISEEKLECLKAPPPAYGLWRCSVQVNPSLLYWQRVDSNATPKDRSTARTHQPNPTVQGQEQREGPRPPSYLSDDGVEYVVSAEPRNTVYLPQPTDDIHPAYRDCLGPV